MVFRACALRRQWEFPTRMAIQLAEFPVRSLHQELPEDGPPVLSMEDPELEVRAFFSVSMNPRDWELAKWVEDLSHLFKSSVWG